MESITVESTESDPKAERAKGQLDPESLFGSHTYTPEQANKLANLRAGYKACAYVLINNTPMSADQRDAFRKLRESYLTAREAIRLNGSLTGEKKGLT